MIAEFLTWFQHGEQAEYTIGLVWLAIGLVLIIIFTRSMLKDVDNENR